MKRVSTKAIAVVSAFATAAVLTFTAWYLWAVKRVHDNDPRKVPPVAEAEYLAAPKHIGVGAMITRDEVAAHLERVGYKRGNGRDPGTFDLGTSEILLQPRQSDFAALNIQWNGSRIAHMSDSQGRAVLETELEPETLHLRGVSGAADEQLRIRRYPVTFDELRGTPVLDALLSSEDSAFFEHGGISLLHSVLGPIQHRGGSTLTQQLARACILHDTSLTLSRKVNEIFLAMSLEAQMRKPDIITAYCNCAYWGNAAGGLQLYGIAAASRHLFGKPDVKTLTLSEAAAVAALLNQPARYLHEIRQGNSDRLRNQRNRVLRLMHKNFGARYSAEEIATAEAEAVSLATTEQDVETDLERSSRYFLDYIAGKLHRPEAGTRVYTTLDADMQRAAVKAVTMGAQRLESADGGTVRLQAAMVVLSRDGDLLAMVGGRDYGTSQLNRAVQARRSPGSAMKPFVQIAALESGTLHDQPFTLATIIDPVRDPVDGTRPRNHCGGPATDRALLARSDNCGAAVVGTIATLPRAQEILRRAINANPELGVPMLIGGARGSEASPIDLALGYSILHAMVCNPMWDTMCDLRGGGF